MVTKHALSLGNIADNACHRNGLVVALQLFRRFDAFQSDCSPMILNTVICRQIYLMIQRNGRNVPSCVFFKSYSYMMDKSLYSGLCGALYLWGCSTFPAALLSLEDSILDCLWEAGQQSVSIQDSPCGQQHGGLAAPSRTATVSILDQLLDQNLRLASWLPSQL